MYQFSYDFMNELFLVFDGKYIITSLIIWSCENVSWIRRFSRYVPIQLLLCLARKGYNFLHVCVTSKRLWFKHYANMPIQYALIILKAVIYIIFS